MLGEGNDAFLILTDLRLDDQLLILLVDYDILALKLDDGQLVWTDQSIYVGQSHLDH